MYELFAGLAARRHRHRPTRPEDFRRCPEVLLDPGAVALPRRAGPEHRGNFAADGQPQPVSALRTHFQVFLKPTLKLFLKIIEAEGSFGSQ